MFAISLLSSKHEGPRFTGLSSNSVPLFQKAGSILFAGYLELICPTGQGLPPSGSVL